jgi:hypothetical protein
MDITYFKPYTEWALIPVKNSENETEEKSNEPVPVEEIENERDDDTDAAYKEEFIKGMDHRRA